MLAIFTNAAYDFIGKRRWAYAASVAVMLLGLASMVVKGGLRYDIDFTGGTLVEVRMAQPVPIAEIRSRLAAAGLGESIIQIFDDPRDVLIRTHLAVTNAKALGRRIVGALDPTGAAMLFWFGGGSLENFGFVVLVGALTGTTSTVCVAGALDVDWSAWADRRPGRPSGSRRPRSERRATAVRARTS